MSKNGLRCLRCSVRPEPWVFTPTLTLSLTRVGWGRPGKPRHQAPLHRGVFSLLPTLHPARAPCRVLATLTLRQTPMPLPTLTPHTLSVYSLNKTFSPVAA